jgi:hypothetical protein
MPLDPLSAVRPTPPSSTRKCRPHLHFPWATRVERRATHDPPAAIPQTHLRIQPPAVLAPNAKPAPPLSSREDCQLVAVSCRVARCKVFGLQAKTLELVAALQALAPDRKLNARCLKIVGEGTGKTFELEHNQRWDEVTRPILEAFFHARFFLECAVRSARTLRAPPQLLPSDWAALHYLFDLR